MYICLECGYEFERPARICEKHEFSLPPYEIICVCPHCKTTDYEKIKTGYCRCCGAKLKPTQQSYCSRYCKNRGEYLRQKEENGKKALTDSPIFTLVRELDAYNNRHNTKLSYGQFVAFVEARKKGKRKNAKK